MSREERLAYIETVMARYDEEVKPICVELRALGFDITEISQLGFYGKYRDAIPVLVSWLPRVEFDRLRDDIIRALSVPWAKAARPMLMQLYSESTDNLGFAGRATIGNALEAMMDDSIYDEMIEFATNRERYGQGRPPIILGLARMKNHPEVVDVLIDLLRNDDQVQFTAIEALGKLRAKKAAPYIEPFLRHPDPDFRTWAKRALAKIAKAPQ
jgi:hypothetical protein